METVVMKLLAVRLTLLDTNINHRRSPNGVRFSHSLNAITVARRGYGFFLDAEEIIAYYLLFMLRYQRYHTCDRYVAKRLLIVEA